MGSFKAIDGTCLPKSSKPYGMKERGELYDSNKLLRKGKRVNPKVLVVLEGNFYRFYCGHFNQQDLNKSKTKEVRDHRP